MKVERSSNANGPQVMRMIRTWVVPKLKCKTPSILLRMLKEDVQLRQSKCMRLLYRFLKLLEKKKSNIGSTPSKILLFCQPSFNN